MLAVIAEPITKYNDIFKSIEDIQGYTIFCIVFWLIVTGLLIWWWTKGITLPKLRLTTQIFLMAGFNTFFFFGQPYISPILLPLLQCNHLNTNFLNCVFGPLQRVLTTHMTEIIGYFPFAPLGAIILTAALLGRGLCAWACPAGVIFDVVSYLRQWLFKHGYNELPRKFHEHFIYFKYAYLSALLLLCVSIGLSILADPIVGYTYRSIYPEVFRYEPICMLCPAPALTLFWPLLIFPTSWTGAIANSSPDWGQRIGILMKDGWTFLVIGLGFVIFTWYVRRPYCRYFCPLGALMGLFSKFSLIAIHKDIKRCTKCGTCARVCPMAIKKITDEEQNPRIVDAECTMCLDCVAKCPETNLRLMVGNKTYLPLRKPKHQAVK